MLPWGQYRPGTDTGPEQTARRSSWILHPWRSWRLSKTKPCLIISSADESPALSRRLDCMTSRSVSQPLQNLKWFGFCSSFSPLLLFPHSKMTVAHVCVWKSKQRCQKAYPTNIKAFTNDIQKTLLLFLRENNNKKHSSPLIVFENHLTFHAWWKQNW